MILGEICGCYLITKLQLPFSLVEIVIAMFPVRNAHDINGCYYQATPLNLSILTRKTLALFTPDVMSM